MAKSRKQDGDRDESAEQGDSPETLPMNGGDAGAAEGNATPAESLPRWKIRPKSGEAGESIVQAATVEDAIRNYNGASTQYAAKQLIVEAL